MDEFDKMASLKKKTLTPPSKNGTVQIIIELMLAMPILLDLLPSGSPAD